MCVGDSCQIALSQRGCLTIWMEIILFIFLTLLVVDHQGLGIAAIIFLNILRFLHVSSRLSHWTPLFFLCMGQVAQMLGSGVFALHVCGHATNALISTA
jgi:hypothetical protein